MYKIKFVYAREILDSRGNPTVETKIELDGGFVGTFGVPSGASTGIYEALELRDGDKARYGGKGVLTAVKNTNTTILNELKDKEISSQEELDAILLKLDGTKNKSNLGANAILGVSCAFTKACAKQDGVGLYEKINEIYKRFGGKAEMGLPTPSFNIINGGKHGENGIDFQEFMILPEGVTGFSEKVRCGAEIFAALKSTIKSLGLSVGVGDEGGFAPQLGANVRALEVISEAVAKTNWKFGIDVKIALDVAASEFYKEEKYNLDGETPKLQLSSSEMINFLKDMTEKYPITSIEDGLAEDDWNGWTELTAKLGSSISLVGDDLLVTNVERLQTAIEKKACNYILIKLNQIGSLTETLNSIILAQNNSFGIMISHRSGETTDSTIADLAVGVGAERIKSGATSRSERLEKYNRLMEIEKILA